MKVAVLIETDRINDYHYIGVFKDSTAAFIHVLSILRKEKGMITDSQRDTENNITHLYTSKGCWDYDIIVNQEVQVW